jgi:hypothetical protein
MCGEILDPIYPYYLRGSTRVHVQCVVDRVRNLKLGSGLNYSTEALASDAPESPSTTFA